jgi:hypothetical protein
VPSTSRFDRIDISNLGDIEYGGIGRVLDAWGPFLKRTNDSTLLGHFMNWYEYEDNAEIGDEDFNKIVDRLIDDGRVGASKAIWVLFPLTPVVC